MIDLFISCKDTDEEGKVTLDLIVSREVAKTFRNLGYEVFISDDNLAKLGTSEFKKTIDEALDEARALIVVTSSKTYAESNWVQYEWNSFYGDYLSGVRKEANLFTLTINMSATSLPRTLRNSECFRYKDDLDKLIKFIESCLGKKETITEVEKNFSDNSPSRFYLIPPEEITPEDINEVLNMESEVYTEEGQQELEHCLALYAINPYIYLFFKDLTTGKIVGNIDIEPISDECYELIRSGKFLDKEITPNMLQSYDMPSIYNLYFCGIMIRKEYRNTNLFMVMFEAVVKRFIELGERGILPKRMIADAVTDNGEKFCKMFGMKEITFSEHDSKLYEVSLLPPEFRICSISTKKLFDYFKVIYEQNKEKITLVPVEGAPHGLSFIKDSKTYKAAFEEFLRKTI